MSENKIYEITKLMQSPENFRNDIQEALEILTNHFRNKYISPIEQEVRCCNEQCRKEPIKETALLEACRPFVKNTDYIDMFINAINSYTVINRLMPREIKISQSDDSSIHNDGIYDVDNSCRIDRLNIENTLGINPIIIALILLLIN